MTVYQAWENRIPWHAVGRLMRIIYLLNMRRGRKLSDHKAEEWAKELKRAAFQVAKETR
jgi:hypothetical protein